MIPFFFGFGCGAIFMIALVAVFVLLANRTDIDDEEEPLPNEYFETGDGIYEEKR